MKTDPQKNLSLLQAIRDRLPNFSLSALSETEDFIDEIEKAKALRMAKESISYDYEITQNKNEIEVQINVTPISNDNGTVTLTLTPEGLENSFCTCSVEYDCRHMFLVANELKRQNTSSLTPKIQQEQYPSSSFLSLLVDKNRPKPEMIYIANALDQMVDHWHRSKEYPNVYEWREIFRSWPYSQFYRKVHAWPSTVKKPAEIIGCVAYVCEKHLKSIPDWLIKFKDYPESLTFIDQLKYEQEVEAWKERLVSFQDNGSAVKQCWDFQLQLDPIKQTVTFTGKSGTNDEFKPLKSKGIKELIEMHRRGDLEIADGAEPIWYFYVELFSSYSNSAQTPLNLRNRTRINRLLMQSSTQSRIVHVGGQPFVMEEEEIVWEVQEPAHGSRYYDIRLSNTCPLHRRCWLSLPGKPTLYVSGDRIWKGNPPPVLDNFDSTSLSVPEAVIESAEGVDLLQRMQVEFPNRLAKKVRHIKPKIRIRVWQEESGYASSDYFRMTIETQPEAGYISELYYPSEWKPRKYTKEPYPELVWIDRSGMRQISNIFTHSNWSWDSYSEHWRMRVTKAGPGPLVEWLEKVPKEISIELAEDLSKILEDPIVAKAELQCEETDIDWFDVRLELKVSDTTLTKEELDLLLKAQGKFVMLPGRGWKRLKIQLSDEDRAQISSMGIHPEDFSGEKHRLHALQLSEAKADRFFSRHQLEKIQQRAREVQTRVTPDVPATIQAELRPYQKEGFHFLSYLSTNHFGGILADDMGLGKTLQALTWLAWLKSTPQKDGAVLVVCPKSVMDNWQDESKKFFPSLKVHRYDNSSAGTFLKKIKSGQLVVIHYAQLRSLSDALSKLKWLAVILDEGQAIKNPTSQTAEAACDLQADYRLVLTGTPIENRLMDLWSLMRFAMPGALGNRASFSRQFDEKSDVLARRRLAARIRPFLLRRTKNQVATDLPERIEEEIHCEMEGVQKKLYQAELKKARSLLLKLKTHTDLDKARFNILVSLLRLRQICCHPALVMEEAKQEASAKTEAFLETVESIMEEGQKVLVFSQFVQMLGLLQDEIKKRGWKHFILTGDTENRGELVQEFQKCEEPAIFLMSLKAGGVGLNLTAASYVFLYDPWWNPAVENQAIDRTHRIGQTNTVIAYRLIIKESIEEKIRTLQKSKSQLAQDILGEENFTKTLTLDDFRWLLEASDTPE